MAKTRARELLDGGSVAIGVARGSAIASDPVGAFANVNVSGASDGQIT